MIASNCDKFPVNCDKFPVRICLLWITLMFAIVPRETFCCQFLLFSCSAGLFAVLLASLLFCWSMLVCWLFCRSAGFSAALPLCWCAAGALVYRATAASLSFCLPVLWCFSAVGHIAALLICAASTFHAVCLFSCPIFSVCSPC